MDTATRVQILDETDCISHFLRLKIDLISYHDRAEGLGKYDKIRKTTNLNPSNAVGNFLYRKVTILLIDVRLSNVDQTTRNHVRSLITWYLSLSFVGSLWSQPEVDSGQNNLLIAARLYRIWLSDDSLRRTGKRKCSEKSFQFPLIFWAWKSIIQHTADQRKVNKYTFLCIYS